MHRKRDSGGELLVITKVFDYLKWISPLLNHLPRNRWWWSPWKHGWSWFAMVSP